MNGNFQNIPEEMKQYPHWVVWKLEEKKGKEKPDKMPYSVNHNVKYSPSGRRGSTTAPGTWGTFDKAVNLCEKGGYDGIGFVFENTPFVGIDIDGGIDSATGELRPEAADIIGRAGSYTEVSQSGKGFHIVVRATLPEGGRRNDRERETTGLGYEMYGHGSPHYFAMTGNLWGNQREIIEDQDAVDQIHKKYIAKPKQETKTSTKGGGSLSLTDSEVLEKAFNAKNGETFRDLYNGNWRGKYGSQSEADMAFCNMLAFWTGCNDDQMDRIFRSSGLMRSKWNEKHGLQTYGEMTITEAIDKCDEVYTKTTVENVANVSAEKSKAEVNLDYFHYFNEKGNPTSVSDFRIMEHVLKQECIFVMSDIPYIYKNGIYEADIHGGQIKAKIQKLCYEKFKKSKIIKGVYDLLVTQHHLQRTYKQINCYPKHWINFKNGMLDPMTGELHPHKPEYFSINQIPWVYDPNKKSLEYPASRRFLETAFNPDDVKTLFQFIGLCMTTETAFQHFLVLLGNGGNGKSVLLNIVEYLLGENNVSNIALQELSHRFQGARLFGKLANICADIPATLVEDPSMIKKLTGGDTITREYKGKDATEFAPYAKHIFSANRFPYTDDKSDGFMRRLRVIVMDKKPEKPDMYLKEKLAKEIDFWIINAVEGLKELLETNELHESDQSKACRQDIEKKNNSIAAFIADCLVPQEGSKILRSAMQKEYKDYCEVQERTPVGRNSFYDEMEKKGFSAPHSNGHFYRDIIFKAWRDEENAPFD